MARKTIVGANSFAHESDIQQLHITYYLIVPYLL